MGACGGSTGADRCTDEQAAAPAATAPVTPEAAAPAPLPRLDTPPPIAAVSDLEHAPPRRTSG